MYDVDTILIFRIGSLGDTVVALPCFHQIARTFASSRRIVITDVPASTKVAPLEHVLSNSGLIDGVIYFPSGNRTLRDFLNLRARIQETKSTTLIYVADRDLFSTLRDICFFRLCGLREIIGAPFSRDLRLMRIDPESGYTEREAERLARCLQPIGHIDLNDSAFWDLRLQPSEINAAERELVTLNGLEYFVISLGGKVQNKDWGDKNWSTLVRLMGTELSNFAIVFIGSADEFGRCDRLSATWPGKTLNLCGRLMPRESAAAMRRAALFIGHDNGPMHLAAATGIPCVSMFGNFNVPRSWHPFGKNHRIIHNMQGVQEISPAEVYAAIRSILVD